MLTFPPELLLKAQGVRVVFFELLGVLSDAGLQAPCEVCSASQESSRATHFYHQDATGLQLLIQAGVIPVVVAHQDTPDLSAALKAIAVKHVLISGDSLVHAADRTLLHLGVGWQETAVMASDWPSLGLLKRAALTAAPSDAHAEIKARADYLSPMAAGHGAARGLCDLLLVASGRYARLLQEFAA